MPAGGTVGAVAGRSLWQRHWPFLLILAGTLVIRLVVLVLGQTHVYRDEAVIGMMANRINERSELPFYFEGQHYNAAGAWEAYLAAAAFKVFGMGVLPLKGCIMVLSLVWTTLLYRLADVVYGRRTALLAVIAFVLLPTMLKWNFQVRGYSFYLIAVPTLALLYWRLDSVAEPRSRYALLFGLACGITLWGLELGIPLVAALWVLLAVRRRLAGVVLALASGGFVIGYGPVLVYNLTHGFSNWQAVLFEKTSVQGWQELQSSPVWTTILFNELPKFFGPDTTFFYFEKVPWLGWGFYVAAVAAAVLAVAPFLKSPLTVWRTFLHPEPDRAINPDLLMLLLIAACSITYLTIKERTANYFLGSCFFISILIGRLLDRTLFSRGKALRFAGFATLATVVFFGLAAVIRAASQDGVDTLLLTRHGFKMAHVPAEDIEGVHEQLRQLQADSCATGMFLVGTFTVESGGRVATSDATEPNSFWFPPGRNRIVFVLETSSPYCDGVVDGARQAGLETVSTVHGMLTVIQVLKAR